MIDIIIVTAIEVPITLIKSEAPAVLALVTPSLAPSVDTAVNHAQPLAGVKRKKSRVYVPVDDEEESEGAQGDAEYGGLRTDNSSAWVSDSRRRSMAHHTSTSRRIDTGDELRRHSMAV